MNNLDFTMEQIEELIDKTKVQITKEVEVKESIERGGEAYEGELDFVIENIKDLRKMLEILESKR